MSDKLDNDLKNRIREVFDHYEDDTADAGWELLRQRFPEEKKRRVIAWWWYSAAAVLLLCLGTWFFYPQTTSNQMAVRKKTTTDKTDTNSAQISSANTGEAVAVNKNTGTQSAESIQTNEVPAADNTQSDRMASRSSAEKEITGNKANRNQSLGEPINDALALAALNPGKHSHVSKNQPANQSQSESTMSEKAAKNDPFEYIKTDKTTQSLARVKEQPAIVTPKAGATDSAASYSATQVAVTQPAKASQSVVIQKTDPVLKMIANDDARRLNLTKNATNNKKKESAKSDRSIIMSLYAGTYFNYAKGSQSQLGIGGGFSSDFRISDNFKISTGVSIGQNRLSYSSDNAIPQQISNQALAMANKSAAVAPYSLVTSLRSTVPEVQSYNASLVGLDIPLNIKYQFNPKKNDTYISAGLSSGTYINETYRSAYSNGNNAYNAVASGSLSLNAVNSAVQQTQENTSSQHFSSFDFARTLNLSFGMGYPVGRNRLVIEPFLKYPLSGLGAQDIKFGASGINLKLSFSTSKK